MVRLVPPDPADPAPPEPLSLDLAKKQVRQDQNVDDELIQDAIVTARERVEERTGRALIPQTWELVLDRFPEDPFIRIPKPPLREVTSVKYYDTEGTEVLLDAADYLVDTDNEPGRIVLGYQKSWPSIALRPWEGIVIRFEAGYATVGVIPRGIKQLVKFLVAHYYGNRGPTSGGGRAKDELLPEGLEALMWQYKILEVA